MNTTGRTVWAVLAMLVLMVAGHLRAAAQSTARPNIVVILSDDHAYQAISAYGSRLTQTPHIDRIAREGALFNKAYVTNSICGPSRATILSGRYSHKNGFKDNVQSDFNFNQHIFVKDLQQAGYQTAWIGKMHLGDSTPQGFDYYNLLPGQGHYYNPDFIGVGKVRKQYHGYVTNIITDLSEQWLNGRDKDKPFCLVIGHKATHRVWMPDLPDLGLFENKTFPLPANFYDNYATRKAAMVQDMSIDKTMLMDYDLKMYDSVAVADRQAAVKRMDAVQKKTVLDHYKKIYDDLKARKLSGKELVEWKYQRYLRDYLATAASLDRNIGRVLDYLDQHDLTKNTIVIYLSDQGFYMGEHGWFDKRFMYEESFRTPMVMRYPGVIKPGSKVNDFVMNLDIAPTLLDAAKANKPADLQGLSFLPLFNKGHHATRDALYYHYYENGEHAVSPHFGIKTKRYKLIRFYKRVESWELFDLEKDPHELNNIYPTPKGKEVAAGLKKQLAALIDQYEDTEAKVIFEQSIE
ncbi:sulfatase [Paraflavitalea sp. CAU 1676]|uniref:sulfatase family protein n=1 Tax=Paraflavitalea sp. CAU 1676 TaxID=3032598 RepID=UPI0023DC9F76|nr:sulfatase [Paraflavitalea sp. CAU 1676]MDF2193179.1 sulfatase [Paraflavitalea sp. CAU 1676]